MPERIHFFYMRHSHTRNLNILRVPMSFLFVIRMKFTSQAILIIFQIQCTNIILITILQISVKAIYFSVFTTYDTRWVVQRQEMGSHTYPIHKNDKSRTKTSQWISHVQHRFSLKEKSPTVCMHSHSNVHGRRAHKDSIYFSSH